MIQTLLDDIKAYFDAKANPTEEEKQLKQRLSEGYFPITSVHRDDLQGVGFDVERISDDDMKELARKMANDYCEQLFWGSMEIIAEILGFPKKKNPVCPKCESEYIHSDTNGVYHCNTCGQTWNDKLYVLVEFPEDTSPFEKTGYLSWNSEDNGALYVSEEEYIRHNGKSPSRDKCYRAVCWPNSQKYMDTKGCELIQDEDALQEFGSSAYWVPLSLIK